MENLAADEKSTLVMIYTQNSLVRGELVTKESARVGIWPRNQSVPNLIRLFKPNVMLFGGSPPRPVSCNEIFLPAHAMIGFHLAPPHTDSLDYDEQEKNRSLEPVSLLMGPFIVKGQIRIATTISFSASLDLAFHGWQSIYNAEVSTPFLAQMPPIQVPMLLVNPGQVSLMI